MYKIQNTDNISKESKKIQENSKESGESVSWPKKSEKILLRLSFRIRLIVYPSRFSQKKSKLYKNIL